MVNLHDASDPHYVLGIWNSRVLRFYWLKKFYDHRVTFPKIKGTYLKQLPIPHLNGKQTEVKEVARRVRRIMELGAQREAARLEQDRNLLEQRQASERAQVEKLVYEAFGVDEGRRAEIEAFLASSGGL